MKEKIKKTIEILTSNRGEDWFSVIEEPKSEKFIQFTYDEGYGLQIDLPVVALQPEELQKAEKLMAEYGIAKRVIEPSEDDCCCCGDGDEHGEDCDCNCCDGEEDCEKSFESFNEKMENNDKAIEIACRVFKEVYGLSDKTDLNITIFR